MKLFAVFVVRVLSSELAGRDGETVEIAGWVHSVRDIKKLLFAVVRDRAGKVQVTFREPELLAKARSLGLEDVVVVRGTVRANPSVKMGGVEVEASSIEVLSKAASPLPVDVAGKTETGFEARFDHRFLDLRREKPHALFKVRATLCSAFKEFLSAHGFLEVHTPKIIATGTEGGTSMFAVKYFERQAFLAQSPQFYKQMLVGAGFERVFELSPVFRAEEHNTPFHLNEYVSMDVEQGFIKDEGDVMRVCEQLVSFMVARVKQNNSGELAVFGVDLQPPKTPFPVLRYWELPEIMALAGKKFAETDDLSREHEQIICDYALKNFGSPFVFVDNYPLQHRPAYTMPLEDRKGFTRGFDLLFNGLEIVTGGQRIHDYELLQARFKEKGFKPENFEFYFEAFKYGMPPHGGFAIGLERLTAKLLGLQNVREAAFFPRDRTRLVP
ncbi:MAG: aspartate--tRNA(Asn) ligase [Candidatus Norongarragalinales archaeon]